jgi:hypothetical protein
MGQTGAGAARAAMDFRAGDALAIGASETIDRSRRNNDTLIDWLPWTSTVRSTSAAAQLMLRCPRNALFVAPRLAALERVVVRMFTAHRESAVSSRRRAEVPGILG